MPESAFYIGTAGWSIPAAYAESFPASGSHLERYARLFPAVEINSSFYRAHKAATYERWAKSVPSEFRFAVKIPRAITHIRRLKESEAALLPFLEACAHLGEKLGPLLVQLPPNLPFDPARAEPFFAALRAAFTGYVVCEPRHPSWFTADVEALLTNFQVARVAADPAVVPQAAEPGGWNGLVYYRLHGSPRIYYSNYSHEFLSDLARNLKRAAQPGKPVWCIFDNTAAFHAIPNALALMRMG